MFFFFFLINLFILFLAALGLRYCAQAFSLVAASKGYSSLQCTGFSLRWLLLLQSTGSRPTGSVVMAHGSRAQAQKLWRMGLVAPRNVGSSRTRAWTHVPCIGRRILNCCATREAQHICSWIIVESNNCLCWLSHGLSGDNCQVL